MTGNTTDPDRPGQGGAGVTCPCPPVRLLHGSCHGQLLVNLGSAAYEHRCRETDHPPTPFFLFKRLDTKSLHQILSIFQFLLLVAWLNAQTIVCAATLTQKLLIILYISPSHSILTSGQPVPALTLQRQAPGRVATGVPVFTLLV